MACQKTGAGKKFLSAPGLKQVSFIATLVCLQICLYSMGYFFNTAGKQVYFDDGVPAAKCAKTVQGCGLTGLG